MCLKRWRRNRRKKTLTHRRQRSHSVSDKQHASPVWQVNIFYDNMYNRAYKPRYTMWWFACGNNERMRTSLTGQRQRGLSLWQRCDGAMLRLLRLYVLHNSEAHMYAIGGDAHHRSHLCDSMRHITPQSRQSASIVFVLLLSLLLYLMPGAGVLSVCITNVRTSHTRRVTQPPCASRYITLYSWCRKHGLRYFFLTRFTFPKCKICIYM